MRKDYEVWEYTINMTLATYLSSRPEKQLRIMARRYRAKTSNVIARRVLRSIIKSPNPVALVRLSYEYHENRNISQKPLLSSLS